MNYVPVRLLRHFLPSPAFFLGPLSLTPKALGPSVFWLIQNGSLGWANTFWLCAVKRKAEFSVCAEAYGPLNIQAAIEAHAW